MLSDKRLAIIGGGNMGEAMLKGLIVAQLIKPQQRGWATCEIPMRCRR